MADSRIIKWIDSVESGDSASSHCGPRYKRCKRTHLWTPSPDFSLPYNTQEPLEPQYQQPKHGNYFLSPPVSDEMAHKYKGNSRGVKRAHAGHDNDLSCDESDSVAAGDPTPQHEPAAKKAFYSNFNPSNRQNDSQESMKHKLARYRSLKLPPLRKMWVAKEALTLDGFSSVRSLYESIALYQKYVYAVPKAVKTEFTEQWKLPGMQFGPPEYFFREDAGDICPIEEFNILKTILGEAEDAQFNDHYENHWLSNVHTPILNHVFMKHRNQIGVVNITSATLLPDCDNRSITRAMSLGSTQSPGPEKAASTRAGQIVDVAIALKLKPVKGLSRVIEDMRLSHQAEGKCFYVNQTNHGGVNNTIIAIAIGAKRHITNVCGGSQIENWTSAWHKQMKSHREYIFNDHIRSFDNQRRAELRREDRKKRLITVPVIVALGHQWQMHFAFFDDDYLKMRGPIRIGSTHNLQELYALVASLRAIGKWILTTFKDAMEDWFMVHQNIDVKDATGDDAEDATGDDAEDSTGDDAEDSTGDDAEDSTGDDAEDSTGDDAEDSTGDDAEDSAARETTKKKVVGKGSVRGKSR